MAAVGKVQVELLTGSEGAHKARGQATEALAAGDPVVISATPSTDTRFDFALEKAVAQEYVFGIVLDRAAAANDEVDVLVRGEMDGFSGLTAGNSLTVVAGSLDTTEVATGVVPQILALNEGRIVKLF